VRDMNSLKELDITNQENGWKIPQEFKMSSLGDVIQATLHRNPFKHPGGQGFIVCDKDFHRIKVLNHQVISLVYGTDWTGVGSMNFDGELDENQMKEIIRSSKWKTFLLYFPEWKDEMERILGDYNYFCDSIQNTFNELVKFQQKKDFAFEAKKYTYSPLLFNLWENSYTSTREYFAIVEEKIFLRMWREFFV